MAEKTTENKDKILDAMWRGDLSVKQPEPPKSEPAQEDKPERTTEEKRARISKALEHLMSGAAFKERED